MLNAVAVDSSPCADDTALYKPMKRPDCIEENVPLAPLTTLEVGGPARYFAACSSINELPQVLAWARSEHQELFVIGGGSNILVADSGFEGVALSYQKNEIEFSPDGASVCVRADAGVNWDQLVARCVERKLAGIECLSGIPGLVGAAPIQNIGAYGQEVSDTIVAVSGIDLRSLEHRRIPREACGFGYRTSVFKTRWKQFLVTGVEFRLQKSDCGLVAYPDIRRLLAVDGDDAVASLADTRAAVLECRQQKSMILTPDDPNRRSAGSFFVNPVLSRDEFESLRSRARQHGVTGDVPSFPAADNKLKVPAAWLIEQSGFRRGTSEGAVGLSTRHALAIVNRGGAKAEDIIRFATRIRTAVHNTFGIALTPEPVLVG